MEKWRENRFGIFIHWGLYSILGGEYKGKSVDSAEWIRAAAKVPVAEYDALVKQFNPDHFDARAWARQFKRAGAKYVVITTKHHDGFCLWDSPATTYDLGSSPARKDILRQLADAVRAEGMDFGVYYSILDWHHSDYRTNLKTDDDKVAYRRYLDYMKGQLKELLTTLGPVKVLWFDGRWEPSYKQNPQYGIEVESYCRSLSPGLIMNDRVRAYDSIADYDSGYERRLPEKEMPDRDWEACMTMTEASWGYHRNPPGTGWKTPQTLLKMLFHCSSKSGNFLLNIGPKPDGTIRTEEVTRLNTIGSWLKPRSEAIYETQGSLITTSSPCFATRKGNKVYLAFFQWPETSRVTLTGLTGAIQAASLAGRPIGFSGNTIELPMFAPDPLGNVVELTLKP